MLFLRRRVIIPNDRAVLQNPKDLHCDSHIGSFQVSNQHHYLPLTLQAPLDLLDHKTQAAKKLVQQPGPIAQPSLVLDPTLNSQLFGLSGKWAGVTYPNQEHAISKTQRDPRGIMPRFFVFLVLVVGGTRCSNISSTLEGIFHHAPHHQTPRDFTEVEGP